MNIADPSAARAKILNLQILRFIAALGVLVSHAADLALPAASPLWFFPWTAGVDIFFVISGVIMTILTDRRFGQSGATRQFLIRRIIRIVPIYWLFTALLIATILAVPDQVHHSAADPLSVAASLSFIPLARDDGQIVPILAQGWTLNYEAMFYAAFALALLHRRGLRMLVAGLTALALLHALIPVNAVQPYFWSDPIILEFVTGIGLAKLWLGGTRLSRGAATIIAIASLVLFVVAAAVSLGDAARFIARGIPAAALCSAFLFAPEPTQPGIVRRGLVAAGDASYALYLSHTFTINAVVLAVGATLPGWATTGVAIIAAIAGSLLVHRMVERPMLKALHQRFAGPAG